MSILAKTLAACALSIVATAAAAAPMTYTFSGVASGQLGDKTFTDAKFSFVGVADSDAEKPIVPGESFIPFEVIEFKTEGGLSSNIRNMEVFAGQTEDEIGFGLYQAGDGSVDYWDWLLYGAGTFAVYDVLSQHYSFSESFASTDSAKGSFVNDNPLRWATSAGTLSMSGVVSEAAFSASTASAVPEPESYAMMLAGLGALGFMGRRRAR